MKWQHFLRMKYTLCVSQDEFDKALKSVHAFGGLDCYLGDGASGMTHYYLQGGTWPVSIVCVDIDRDSEDVISTILHETVHVWQNLIGWMDEEKPGQEIEAYSIQCLFEVLRKMYQERSKKC